MRYALRCCRDIRKLDYAKRHLTNAITALRRLAMLTAAVAGVGSVRGSTWQYIEMRWQCIIVHDGLLQGTMVHGPCRALCIVCSLHSRVSHILFAGHAVTSHAAHVLLSVLSDSATY